MDARLPHGSKPPSTGPPSSFAGGGFRKGIAFGETDEFGYKAVVNRVGTPDMIATVLNQMGLDHRRVQYPYGGRMETPSDVTVSGAKVVPGLVSDPPQIT